MDGRAKQFHMRLSDDEMESLQANAATMGCSVSEYVRLTAVKGGVAVPVRLDMEPLRQALFELQRQGNNLNQLARRANQTSDIDPTLVADIERGLAWNKRAIEGVVSVIKDIREGRLLV